MSTILSLVPGALSIPFLEKVYQTPVTLALAESDYDVIDSSHESVKQIIAKNKSVYGINTGFGLLAKTRIDDEQLELLQRNLILSHSVGTGEYLDDEVVRLILVMKAASLARGFSGVRRCIVDALLNLVNHNIMPLIPSKGSVGASGDLAPLAHMTLALLGEGNVRVNGKVEKASVALQKARIKPLSLAAKEGLALINGTQVSTALAWRGWFMAKTLLESATVVGALSIDAAKGSDAPFDPRIHEVRGQIGQIQLAATYRQLLQNSPIRASHLEHCERIQDPYSLRCQPQVMGACLDLINHVANVLLIEANAVTDNPLLFTDDDEVIALSGGNFHAEPIAFAADTLALAIAEIGAQSERRIALLIDATLSELPAFLVRNPGINSGFMIAHVTAAALASENKSMAHPASVDSLPTSANQEDHVSMATYAARRLADMVNNAATIVAIEYLAAAQGIDFHLPLTTAKSLQKIHQLLREKVPHYDKDRLFAPDIENAKQLVLSGLLNRHWQAIRQNWYHFL